MTQIDRRQMLAATALMAVPLPAFGQNPGWQARTPMPWPVQEIYCAVSAGRIVVVGGLVGLPGGRLRGIEDRVGVYDPQADVWSEGPRLPQARHHPMVVATDAGRVFAIGGYGETDAGQWTGMTEVWSLDDGIWVAGPALPEPQGESVGLAIGDRIHLVTGRTPKGEANGDWNDQGDVSTHRVLADGRWEDARPAPMARNSAAGAVLDGVLWIAGGRTVSGGGTGRLDRYDPVADRWDTMAPILRSHASNNQVGGGLAMVAVDGKLVAFGGEWFASGGGGGVFAETWLYDPATDAWTAGPDMATPRHGLAAAAVDGMAYAIGGSALVSSGATTGVVEALRV